MQKWEYEFVPWMRSAAFETRAKELGQQGWELVSCDYQSRTDTRGVFKRPVVDDHK